MASTHTDKIIATPSRGLLMNSRGCMHDAGDHPLRQYQGWRWIIYVLTSMCRRTPMPAAHYTSLLFLDEATAPADGHRPCGECQRERFTTFRALGSR
jgi:hypothetical protein